ncbi:hypothetical protein [Erwinia sp. JH02]|uniref:hypothetical protein n=1 Tax=Erwinia sp. JH02 TaxID=2733394 RepID=UPI0014882A47|nr:hypothetical protein [Erwinia sp. JH02]NNS07345.1 hypothetical protein [Erwinia sp. JH02]
MSIIDLNTADIFNAIGGGSPLSIINGILHPSYSIKKSGTSETALEFSGMASIQPSGGASIITAPIETGKYQSINKVMRPGRIACDVVVNGLTGYSGAIPNIFDLTFTSQSATLDTIKTMLATAATYDIDTPKDLYEGYDLVDYSYTVNSKRGVTMLVVSLVFQQVLEQMEVALSGSQSKSKPTDDKKSNAGTGTGGDTKNGAAEPSTIDGLQKSWSSLKTAVGETTSAISDSITQGFTSAIDTVKSPLVDVATSATDKLTGLVSSIKGGIT